MTACNGYQICTHVDLQAPQYGIVIILAPKDEGQGCRAMRGLCPALTLGLLSARLRTVSFTWAADSLRRGTTASANQLPLPRLQKRRCPGL